MIDIEVTNDYNSNLSYDRKSIKYLFEQVFNKENIHSAKLSLILSDRKYLNEAFDSNWIAPLGPHVDAFESEMSKYLNIGQ